MNEFNGKSVLITGASLGLGRALSEEFAQAGARVGMVARDRQRLENAASEISRNGGVAIPIVGDLGDQRSIYPIAAQAFELVGPIDILINNASTLGPLPMPLLMDTACEDLLRVLEVNLVGAFRLTKAIAGPMILRGDGLVINISSDAAVSPYPGWGAYSVSKAALDHLTRILAVEFQAGSPLRHVLDKSAQSGIRVVCIDPGEMDTQMHAHALPDADREQLRKPEWVARQIIDKILENPGFSSGERIIL